MKTLHKADLEARRAANPGTVLNIQDNGTRYLIVGTYSISYFGNGGSTPEHPATNFYVKRLGDRDELQSDYFAGMFEDTLTAAIRTAREWSEKDARDRVTP